MHTENQNNPNQADTYRFIPWNDLSENERKVLGVLDGKGKGRRLHLTRVEIAKAAFPEEAYRVAYSRTNNALRRLCLGNWTEREGETYLISHEGRTIYREMNSAN